jgi:hypothetical protein
MTAAVQKSPKTENAAPVRREARFPVLVPKMLDEHPALLDWAQAVTTAASERVATLEARLAYLETQVACSTVVAFSASLPAPMPPPSAAVPAAFWWFAISMGSSR